MDKNNVLDEIKKAIQPIADKYFISTFCMQIAIREESGTDSLFLYDGSFPEAIGLLAQHSNELINGNM